ncbi:UNVERIFIED_ORG: DNA repair exonuclease SbcCD ATPase subunit [Pseudomonas parafulva]|nr:DNA repair exonuclease SbcCD ATPase subunit [Pseudomonas parafulva]
MERYADYFAALERLVEDCPLVVSRGALINYDNVALEAGRKKGAIRRERENMAALRKAIDDAAQRQRALITPQDRLNKANEEAAKYKSLWEQSIGREICLARQIIELKEKIKDLKAKMPLRLVK